MYSSLSTKDNPYKINRTVSFFTCGLPTVFQIGIEQIRREDGQGDQSEPDGVGGKEVA